MHISHLEKNKPFGWLHENTISRKRILFVQKYLHSIGVVFDPQNGFQKPHPLPREYICHQETLRVKLLDDLRRSERFREVATDEHIWMNFKLMEIFDQMAQFLCNRYPLNSKARHYGPTNTLNNVPAPTGPGREDVTLTLDTIDEQRAILRPYPFDVDPLNISFPARLVPKRSYSSEEEFLREFYKAERITITYSVQSG